AQVEVGGERADAAQRRGGAGFHDLVARRPGSGGSRTDLPRAVRTVTRDAVAAVEVQAALDLRRRRRERRGRRAEQEHDDDDAELHAWWHVRSTTVAIVVSTTISRKSRFERSAAEAKKCSRPCG